MKLKTAILCIFGLTFSQSIHANFSDDTWTFHLNSGDKSFARCGDDLGNPLVKVDDLIKAFNLQLSGKTDLILQNKSGKKVKFSIRHTQVLGDHWSTRLSVPASYVKKQLCVPIDFGDRVLRPLLGGANAPIWDAHLRYDRFATIIIDPGHGGNDWGATVKTSHGLIKEKDLTLSVALALAAALKAKGLATMLTRNQDVYVSLRERYDLANLIHPKIFISLHFNAQSVDRGFEIYTLSTFRRDRQTMLKVGQQIDNSLGRAVLEFKSAAKQELSIDWADLFRQSLFKFLPPVKVGMRRLPLFLLYAVQSPAVLLELGSVDQKLDLDFWLKPNTEIEVSRTLAEVIGAKLRKE